MKPKLALVIATVALPLFLGGCTAGNDGIDALTAPAGTKDVLPTGANLPFLEKVDASTLRLLAEDNGRQYYAAQSTDGTQVCLAVFQAANELGAFAGCGASIGISANKILTVSGSDGRAAVLVRDDADSAKLESEGLRRIHQNLYVGR